VVNVGAVDCDAHKALCQQHGVKGYPAIKALRPRAGAGGWADYAGGRGAKEIADYAVSLIPSAVHHLRSRGDLDALLTQCGGGGGGRGARRGGDRAAWGLCAVLVTDKAEAPSLLRALSSAYRGKVAVGAARAPSALSGKQQQQAEEVVAALAPAGAAPPAPPAVVLVCNGDLRTAEVYAGALKSEPLQRHLNKYAAGKLCSAKVVVDASTDLNAMTVAQLRGAVAARGVDCRGCAEKGDFVRALRAALEQEAASVKGGETKEEL
jgi:hypothetical protein